MKKPTLGMVNEFLLYGARLPTMARYSTFYPHWGSGLATLALEESPNHRARAWATRWYKSHRYVWPEDIMGGNLPLWPPKAKPPRPKPPL
jgi:hypothetical protein